MSDFFLQALCEKRGLQDQRRKRSIMSVIHLTTANFEQEVLNSEIPVLVDFWATWCGPCQMVGPIIEEISNEVKDVKICKLDVDNEPEIASKYQVMSIPTMIVFRNGRPVKTSVGAKPKDAILNMLK